MRFEENFYVRILKLVLGKQYLEEIQWQAECLEPVTLLKGAATIKVVV